VKRIKDFSKVIGIIGRGGNFFPSNESSTEKYNQVFGRLNMTPQHLLDRNGLGWFKEQAERQGYKILVIIRGVNR